MKVKAKVGREFPLRQFVKCGYCNNWMIPNAAKNKYLNYTCQSDVCETRWNDSASANVRGHVIFDYLSEVLTNSVEVTQEKYEEYLQEMRQDLQERKRTLTTQHTNLDTRIGKLEEEYSEMLQGLSKLTDEKAVSQGNVVVSQKLDAIEELRLQKQTVLNEILDIERHAKTKRKELSYDEFSNYFKKLGDRVKNSTNQYEVDMIAKMAFSNCTVNFVPWPTC